MRVTFSPILYVLSLAFASALSIPAPVCAHVATVAILAGNITDQNPPAKSATKVSTEAAPKNCVKQGVPNQILALCVTLSSNAFGYEPVIIGNGNFGQSRSSEVVLEIYKNADATYDVRSYNPQTLQVFHKTTVKTFDAVAKMNMDSLAAFLPPIRPGTGPIFGSSNAGIVQIASFTPTSPYDGTLWRLLSQRGIRSAIASKHAFEVMQDPLACQNGERYFLYDTSAATRDRPVLGMARHNAFAWGYLYSCGAGQTAQSVYGQQQTRDFKNADKMTLIGFISALFPHFDWGAINPVAGLGLGLFNAADSPSDLQNDAVEQAMQQMVDRLCASNSGVACNRSVITKCADAPSSAVFPQAIPDQQAPPNCQPIPASPTPSPAPTLL